MDLDGKPIITIIGCSDAPMGGADGACDSFLLGYGRHLVESSIEHQGLTQFRGEDELYECPMVEIFET
jgi:hypothetical protein